MSTNLLKKFERICKDLDKSAKKDFLLFVSSLSDIKTAWLWSFLQKNPEWLLKISNNIQAKRKDLKQKDRKAWNNIIKKENLDLLEIEIEDI